MAQPFTPEQSEEIDDRIVEMIVAVMGEGELARRCRVIAATRAQDYLPTDDDEALSPVAIGSAALRLECLKLAMKIAGRDPRRLVDLAAVLERQVTMGFKASAASCGADLEPLPPEDSGPHGPF